MYIPVETLPTTPTLSYDNPPVCATKYLAKLSGLASSFTGLSAGYRSDVS